jgi:hypothetical protein
MSTPKRRSLNDLLDLLSPEDVVQLRNRWCLPPSSSVSAHAADFREAANQLSVTSLVRDILSVTGDTLQMVEEVIQLVLEHDAKLRTTGCVLVLENTFALGPQEIESSLKWTSRSTKNVHTSTWEKLEDDFESNVAPLLGKLLAAATVRREVVWREMSVSEVLRRNPAQLLSGHRQSLPIKQVRTAVWDIDASNLCAYYSRELTTLINQLLALPEKDHESVLTSFLTKLRSLCHTLGVAAKPRTGLDARRPVHSGYMQPPEDRERWLRFKEDLLFLADAEEGNGLVKVLRLDLFRHRPQLYELWCLATVLRFFRGSGYKVELKNTATNSLGQLVWNLNYAKSQHAVAIITHPAGQQYWLFYQLFRRGKARDEMPDLALLPAPDPSAQPVWVMDPKHSAAGGYTLAKYREVALRYQAVFNPERTWVVECFARQDLSVSSSALQFTEKAELLLGVSPSQPGRDLLLTRLRVLHPSCPVALAIVDVSGSFSASLPLVRADLQARFGVGRLHSELVVFGESARMLPLAEFLTGGGSSNLGAGTRFRPVLPLVEELARSGRILGTLLLYTDGGFDDMQVQEAKDALSPWGPLYHVMLQ